jgi:hypothetical protein
MTIEIEPTNTTPVEITASDLEILDHNSTRQTKSDKLSEIVVKPKKERNVDLELL